MLLLKQTMKGPIDIVYREIVVGRVDSDESTEVMLSLQHVRQCNKNHVVVLDMLPNGSDRFLTPKGSRVFYSKNSSKLS